MLRSQAENVTLDVNHKRHAWCYDVKMTDGKVTHYIKQWRNERGYSLKKLAELMETSPGEEFISSMSLSRIERGLQPYSEPILEALSAALNTPTWALLNVDPTENGNVVDFMEVFLDMTQAEQRTWTKMIKAAKRITRGRYIFSLTI